MRIAIIDADGTPHSRSWIRPYLTPAGDDCWGDVQYVFNPDGGEFDGLVCLQSTQPTPRKVQISCPPHRTLVVSLEPPPILRVPAAFVGQFECSLSQGGWRGAQKNLIGHSAHHWFAEINIAEAATPPRKSKLLSAVVSSKDSTSFHRKRLAFMKVMAAHFGEHLDWFGRGIRELGARKRDGLADYSYTLVIENGQWPHYWTEKAADAFVADCFPFYCGAPNFRDYFPTGSFAEIDISRPEQAIRIIEEAIAMDLYGRRRDALAEARRRVLHEYHPYETYARILRALPNTPNRILDIRPFTAFEFSAWERWQLRWHRLLAP